jgi:hypothetical protein
VVETTVQGLAIVAADPLVRRVLELDPDLLVPYIVERLGQSQRLAIIEFRRLLAEGHADGSIRPVDDNVGAYLLQLVAGAFMLATRVTERESDSGVALAELRRLLDAYLAPDRDGLA